MGKWAVPDEDFGVCWRCLSLTSRTELATFDYYCESCASSCERPVTISDDDKATIYREQLDDLYGGTEG